MSRFPGNKNFAFSIFDDTDQSTLQNIRPVYRLLRDLGFRTTKSVWPLAPAPGARFGGSTLQDRDYLDYVRSGTAPREIIERGFAEFRSRIGEDPSCHANHSDNRENIYWGSSRLSRAVSRFLYNLRDRYRQRGYFQGDVPDSRYFWGDLCKQRIRYVRNFVFNEINLERINPTL